MPTGDNKFRFVDYFFRAGISNDKDLKKSKINDSIYISNEGNEVGQKEPHPLQNRYEPETLFRYTIVDYSEEEKFPPYTPMVIVTIT
jgi:hypothetical protein